MFDSSFLTAAAVLVLVTAWLAEAHAAADYFLSFGP